MPEARARKPDRDDFAKIVALNAALLREDAGQRDAPVNLAEKSGRGYFEGLLDDRCLCLLAENGGETVDYLACRTGDDTDLERVRVAELESVYMREGRRDQGVGARLSRGRVLGWASVRGADVRHGLCADSECAIRRCTITGFAARSLAPEIGHQATPP